MAAITPCLMAAPSTFRWQALAQRAGSRHPQRMTPPIIISIPHQLGRDEARRRIEAGFAKVLNLLPGSGGVRSAHWDDDRLTFSVAAMGQTVSGVIQVLDAVVTMEIELPGVLRVIASGLTERLQKAGQRLLTKK